MLPSKGFLCERPKHLLAIVEGVAISGRTGFKYGLYELVLAY